MGRRPAKVQQTDTLRILKGAQKIGASAVTFDLGGGVVATISLEPKATQPTTIEGEATEIAL
jgi:hypothetical protein